MRGGHCLTVVIVLHGYTLQFQNVLAIPTLNNSYLNQYGCYVFMS